MYKFLCTLFTTDGCRWTVYIEAKDWQDAESQAKMLSLHLDGEVVEGEEMYPGFGE